MKHFDLRILKSFTSLDQRPFLIDLLTCPHFAPWGQLDSTSFESDFLLLKERLAEDPCLVQLLELYLLAHLLKEGGRPPAWAMPLMQRNISLDRHFPSISWDTLTGGKWTVFPVAMVKGDRKKVRYFMAGRMTGPPGRELLPPWARQLMDRVSRQALLSAAKEALAMHPLTDDSFLFTFPLALPNSKCQFEGASLGLPAALAFMKLLTGKKTSERYLATGTILEKGCVRSVGGLADKHALAIDEGRFSLFVYPEENGPIPGEMALDVFPVSSLDEAWGAVRRHAPGNGKDLLMFARMMKDPAAFVAGMERVDASWIAYEADRGRCKEIVRGMIAQPDLFAGCVARINRKLDVWKLDDVEIFLNLFSSEDLKAAIQPAPLSVFRFYTQRIALANHRGDVASAEAWAEQAEALLPVALKGDLNLCVDYMNNRFVTRHNRYRFDPLFPDDLLSVLKILLRRYIAQCDGGCPTDPVLAKLYGTLAQNFGFCGPDFLSETKDYAEKSMAAFGGGAVPEFRQDLLRQHSYLTYAFLDAEDHPQAKNSLMAFIEAENWHGIMKKCRAGRLSVWHHAALARFLADTGETEKSREYLRWCTDRKELFSGSDHPRQLWAFNMGRIAMGHNIANAVEWFQQSLDLCLEKEKQPTIYIMALLPLSGLWQLGDLDEVLKSELLSKLIQRAVKLNNSRFYQLLNLKRDLLLENTWKRPQSLFPFTYR